MKKILSFLFLLVFAATTQAAFVTETITVTNVPADGDTIVLNGNTRTFKTSVTLPASQITIGADTNVTTTNMFQQIAAHPIAGTILSYGSSNVLIIRGDGATATKTGTWGTIASTSLSPTDLQPMLLPASGMLATNATNLASLTAKAISDYSTNSIDQNAPAVSQLVGLTNDQTISGNKVLSGSNNFQGVAILTNLDNQLSGTFTGAAVFTSLSTFGDDIIGGGVTIYYQFNQEVDPGSGFFSTGHFSWDGLGNVTALSFSGDGSAITNINATNLTSGTIPGARIGTITNLTTQGTNLFGGIIAGTKYSNSALVNGYNADINVGTNETVIVSGPTGSFTNVGFVAGYDQEKIIFKYRGTQSMTFISQSGLDSTSANRLNFGTSGTSFTQTVSPACSGWQYDAANGAWDLLWHN